MRCQFFLWFELCPRFFIFRYAQKSRTFSCRPVILLYIPPHLMKEYIVYYSKIGAYIGLQIFTGISFPSTPCLIVFRTYSNMSSFNPACKTLAYTHMRRVISLIDIRISPLMSLPSAFSSVPQKRPSPTSLRIKFTEGTVCSCMMGMCSSKR